MNRRETAAAGMAMAVLAACHADRPAADDRDSAFAGLQERGAAVMGVDQYTSSHVFEDLPDGGRIVLVRADSADSAGVSVIRAHMREIVADFRAGNFAKPFAVHAMTVPGSSVMAERKSAIAYEARDRTGGAEVRITSTDSAAIRAIHEFLAFQRTDHRAAAHDSGEMDHSSHAAPPGSRGGG